MKVVIARQTAPDETLSVEVSLHGGRTDEWGEKVAPALAELDARMTARSMRYVHALQIVSLFPVRYQAALRTFTDCLLSAGSLSQMEGLPEVLKGIADVSPATADELRALQAKVDTLVDAEEPAELEPVHG